jgi:hypothetical protein
MILAKYTTSIIYKGDKGKDKDHFKLVDVDI